jgi:L-fucose isomerase-like protein
MTKRIDNATRARAHTSMKGYFAQHHAIIVGHYATEEEALSELTNAPIGTVIRRMTDGHALWCRTARGWLFIGSMLQPAMAT